MSRRGKHHAHAAPAATAPEVAPPETSRPTADAPPAAATDDAVRVRAYHLWESAGRPPGDGVEFWCRAERECGTDGG